MGKMANYVCPMVFTFVKRDQKGEKIHIET